MTWTWGILTRFFCLCKQNMKSYRMRNHHFQVLFKHSAILSPLWSVSDDGSITKIRDIQLQFWTSKFSYFDPNCFFDRDSAPAGSVAGFSGREGKIIPACLLWAFSWWSRNCKYKMLNIVEIEQILSDVFVTIYC